MRFRLNNKREEDVVDITTNIDIDGEIDLRVNDRRVLCITRDGTIRLVSLSEQSQVYLRKVGFKVNLNGQIRIEL